MGNPADLVQQFQETGTFQFTVVRWKQGGTEDIIPGMAEFLIVPFRIGNMCIQQFHIRFAHDRIPCPACFFSLTAVNHVPKKIDAFQIAIAVSYTHLTLPTNSLV